MYLTRSPFWLQWLYPTLTWHKDRNEKYVYLTFDDGPIPVVTPFVLNTLKSFNARATFFCIGDNVKNHPEIFAEVLANGHQSANHTFNHLKGWDTTDEVYIENVLKCAELVDSRLFRPPYGRIKKNQIRQLKNRFPDMELIMWDVLSGDFDAGITPEKCAANVLNHTQNGSIIVFHDSVKAFPRLKYALPLVLQSLQSAGYQFRIL